MAHKILVTATGPQRTFLESEAIRRSFVGGIGSGKTYAGTIAAWNMPPGSTGMVLAPTYVMLRDATLRTFLDLSRQAGILREFVKSEMRAVLKGDRQVLFRSADDPDRLRGPNLGWFWLDEAAMMTRQVWLIMIGRLRLSPGKAWLTTTPRGRDWIYKAFREERRDGYDLIRADSRSNTYLPSEFVGELLATYEHDFARQEVAGEFIDDAFGQLIPDDWIDRVPLYDRPARKGHAFGGLDLGEGVGRDHTVSAVLDDAGLLALKGSPWVDIAGAASVVKRAHDQWGIRPGRHAHDAGGKGKTLNKYLEPYRIESMPYHGGAPSKGKWYNRRARSAFRLKTRLDPELPLDVDPGERSRDPWQADRPAAVKIQPPFGIPKEDRAWWPRLAEELRAIRYEVVGGKFKLEKKEIMADRLGRSPDYLDALLVAMSVGDAA